MPKTVTITVYEIGELQPKAREAARDWYRREALPPDWYQPVFEDFTEICKILGIRLRSSKHRPHHIYFSGFCSQGDGASFEAHLSYSSGCTRVIRQYAPEDTALHDIADRICSIQRRNFYQLSADITQSGLYCHQHTMNIQLHRDHPHGATPEANAGPAISETLRDLARWLYRQLETRHEYHHKDHVIDSDIAVNGWAFTFDGRLCRHGTFVEDHS